jgi:hypothetical protein
LFPKLPSFIEGYSHEVKIGFLDYAKTGLPVTLLTIAWGMLWLNWTMQTEIYKIQQEVTLQRAKTQDKMMNKWDDYVRG